MLRMMAVSISARGIQMRDAAVTLTGVLAGDGNDGADVLGTMER